MIVLAVETSGPRASVALAGDAGPVERALSQEGRRHAQTLVAEVASLLADARLAPRDVTAVAVSVGPGSFTGLRVGVVFAKTFAWALGVPLAAVDTLQAIAENSPPDLSDVWILSDALRGEVYVGRYQRAEPSGPFVRSGGVSIAPLADWLRDRAPGEVAGGPGAERLRAVLEGRGLRVLDEGLQSPRALVVARIGYAQLAAGDTSNPATLEPFYLRRPAAEDAARSRGESTR